MSESAGHNISVFVWGIYSIICIIGKCSCFNKMENINKKCEK